MNTSTQTAPVLTQLVHGQEIRVKGFKYVQQITVFTICGYAKEQGRCPGDAVMLAARFGHSIDPSTIQRAAVITANYPGKQAELEAKRAATAAAVEIEEGQEVVIEGSVYRTVVMGERFSDPVHFKFVRVVGYMD